MLILVALQAIAGPPVPASAPMNLRTCAALVAGGPDNALEVANRWYVAGGGVDARLCAAQAHAASGRWPAAAVAFTQGAEDAIRATDARAPHLHVQAGNAWLAADKPAEAIRAFDAALALPAAMSDALRGETLIDRARAHVSANDLAAARVDLDRGVALVPDDPFGWYASASLAARMGDLVRARTEIAKAAGIAPADPGIRTLAAALAAPQAPVPGANAGR